MSPSEEKLTKKGLTTRDAEANPAFLITSETISLSPSARAHTQQQHTNTHTTTTTYTQQHTHTHTHTRTHTHLEHILGDKARLNHVGAAGRIELGLEEIGDFVCLVLGEKVDSPGGDLK